MSLSTLLFAIDLFRVAPLERVLRLTTVLGWMNVLVGALLVVIVGAVAQRTSSVALALAFLVLNVGFAGVGLLACGGCAGTTNAVADLAWRSPRGLS